MLAGPLLREEFACNASGKSLCSRACCRLDQRLAGPGTVPRWPRRCRELGTGRGLLVFGMRRLSMGSETRTLIQNLFDLIIV